MSVTGTSSALTSALNGLRVYGRRVDRAAQSIASIGLPEPPTEPGTTDESVPPPAAAGGAELDLGGAMTDMLIAQRMYVAQLRVLRTADEMLKETISSLAPRE